MKTYVAALKTVGDLRTSTLGKLEAMLSAGGLFKREWFQFVDGPANTTNRVRAWDIAARVAQPGRDADWTVRILVSKAYNTGAYTVRTLCASVAVP